VLTTVSVPYLKTKGNSYVKIRVRRPSDGYLLIFSSGLFQATDDGTTIKYLKEYATTDTYESLYCESVDLPVGDYIIEYYASTELLGVSDSPVLAKALAVSGMATLADVTAAKNTIVAAIPSNPLLTNDIRLNNLDAPISTRVTATSVLSEAYAIKGDSPTLSQLLFMIWGMLSEKAKTGETIISTKRLDNGNVSMTFSLDNGVAPTSITRAT
jgi:hypothetical protein